MNTISIYDSNISQFDINNMINNPKILIIGDKTSGKTELIKDIINRLDVSRGYLMAPSEKETKNLSKLNIFEDSTYYSYNYRTLEMFNNTLNASHNYLVVMDSCILQDLSGVFCQSRKNNVSLIVSMELPMKVPDYLLRCFDYVFMISNTTENEICLCNNFEFMHTYYSAHNNFINKDLFGPVFFGSKLLLYMKSIMQEKYRFMVIDNSLPDFDVNIVKYEYDICGNKFWDDSSGNKCGYDISGNKYKYDVSGNNISRYSFNKIYYYKTDIQSNNDLIWMEEEINLMNKEFII